jgi:hypothetical protein
MEGGKAAGSIEPVPPPGQGFSFIPIAWTPDSQRLLGLASRNAEDSKPQGITYTLVSKSYERLPISGAVRNLRIAPLRDGHHILVSTEDRHGIDLVDTVSAESRGLFPGRPRFSQTWAISPDEKFLYVNRATEQADIWLATLE